MKIKRDAFLYLDGANEEFAQCRTCVFGNDTCSIMNDVAVSPEDGSCCFYIKGRRIESTIASLTKKQTGYVERQVRCENCKFFSAGECMLFHKLNGIFPEIFDLDEKIERYGCCNAQTPG